MPARNPHALFTIEGECWRPQGFSRLDLANIHAYYQVEDLSTVDERLSGRAVRLRKLIDLAGPDHGTRYMTVESADGAYSVCLPMVEISRTAVLVYEQKKGKPLTPEDGGPVRFIIPYYHDACANVKNVGRIVISRKPGKDTRPQDREQHDQLHVEAPKG